jgi:hypothetical protein
MTNDPTALLDRIERQLPADPEAFRHLEDRRDRRAMRRRVGGGMVGVGLTIAILLVGLTVVMAPEEAGEGAFGTAQKRWADVPPQPGPGEYYYVRFSWEGNGTVQLWLAADGSGRRIWRGGAGPTEVEYGPEDGTRDWLVPELSTDPDEFLRQLIGRSGPGGASPVPIATTSPGRSQETTSVLRSMSDLLTFDSALMPGQVQALIVAAEQVDGVTERSEVVDPWGRPAISLTHVIDYPPGPGHDLVWYFDPGTGQFLGEAWINQRSGKVSPGTYVEMSGYVRSDHAVPDPDDVLVHPIP